MNVHGHSGHIALLELSCEMAAHKSRLAHASVAYEQELELRNVGGLSEEEGGQGEEIHASGG